MKLLAGSGKRGNNKIVILSCYYYYINTILKINSAVYKNTY